MSSVWALPISALVICSFWDLFRNAKMSFPVCQEFSFILPYSTCHFSERSFLWNNLGYTFELYCRAILVLQASSQICALLRSLLVRLSWLTYTPYLFVCHTSVSRGMILLLQLGLWHLLLMLSYMMSPMWSFGGFDSFIEFREYNLVGYFGLITCLGMFNWISDMSDVELVVEVGQAFIY